MKLQLLLIFTFQIFIFMTHLNSYALAPVETFPTNVKVQWQQLENENQSPVTKQFVKSSRIIYERLFYGGIPYPNKKITNIWENSYNNSYDKFVYMRKNGVDCTRFLRYLFINMLHLPYNSLYPQEPIISNTFAYTGPKNNNQLKNFIRIPKTTRGFKPQTGDILSFPGHTLAVLDPKNCIAIQSSIWLCKKMENGFCVESGYGKSAGVSIYHLAGDRFCKNGVWKGMDNEGLNFTAGWRHRAFNIWITNMPKTSRYNEKITLIGKNLVEKYIYFTGRKHPIKTKLKINKIKNNYSGLQTVTLIIPKDAKSGKLKIFWGIGKPKLENTLESSDNLIILEKRENRSDL